MDDSSLDIGTLLKERREKLGYSLKDVSERIRIRKVYLENIEANNFSELPGMVYVKGFVDVYSRYLGLDSKEIVSSLNTSEVPETSPVGSVPLPQKFEKQFSSAPEGKRLGMYGWIFLTVLVIALAFILVPGFYEEEPPEEVKLSVPNQAIEPADDKVVGGKDENDSAEELITNKNNEKLNLEEEALPVDDQTEPESLPSILAKGSSLRMLALGNGSLIINVDKREPFNYKLHDGLDLTWKIKNEVSVEMSQAGVVRFWLDGQEIDISGLKSFLLKSAP